jgi:TusA-related sulfurtransferase
MYRSGEEPSHRLDVSGEACPMTFVRTRLQLDRMVPGEVLEVRFRGEEPRRNLPRSLTEQGYAVLALEELEDGGGMLRVRKS